MACVKKGTQGAPCEQLACSPSFPDPGRVPSVGSWSSTKGRGPGTRPNSNTGETAAFSRGDPNLS